LISRQDFKARRSLIGGLFAAIAKSRAIAGFSMIL
jgi:hypothetical protein